MIVAEVVVVMVDYHYSFQNVVAIIASTWIVIDAGAVIAHFTVCTGIASWIKEMSHFLIILKQ